VSGFHNVRLIENEVEIEPWVVLKLQAPLVPIGLTSDHDVGSPEAQNLEVLGELRCIPDLAVLGFQALAFRLGVWRFHRAVDGYQPVAPDLFAIIVWGFHCPLRQAPAKSRWLKGVPA
jgi:hypothetical protein